MQRKLVLLGLTLALLASPLFTVQADTATPSAGYTLTAPLGSSEAILLNNYYEVVHSWDLKYPSGGTAYLLEDGKLLVSGSITESEFFPEAIKTGGNGHIMLYSWERELLWEYTIHSATQLQHHDIEPLPNGHVLAIVYERMLYAEAVAAGRDPDLIPERGEVWSEGILEIDPATDEIVWEWHMWDHFIQDADSTKANYGDPAEHPELIDFNYVVNFPNFTEDYGLSVEWIHANAIDYNAALDQILFSARQFSEFWIIDHSTTTAEAADHSGGTYGQGGDLLYRWGNPAAYRAGDESDQILWFQHDTRWVQDGYPGAGHITLFDNGSYVGRESSRILEIAPAMNADGSYNLVPGEAATGVIVWEFPLTSDFSFAMGGVQRLANGNTLISDTLKLHTYEITPTGVEVWDWQAPDKAYIFRADRYPPDYPVFADEELQPE